MKREEYGGLSARIPEYFMSIALNNSTEFFESTRKQYETDVKRPLYQLAERLQPTMLDIDPEMEVRPSRVVSRIRRDTRFTKDKSPYRAHAWLSYVRMGVEKSQGFGFYYGISTSASSYGAGFYSLDTSRVRRLRESLVAREQDFLRVLTDPQFTARFVLGGDDYKRIAIPETLDPRLHALYRKKNFFYDHEDALGDTVFSPGYILELESGMRALAPLYALMWEIFG